MPSADPQQPLRVDYRAAGADSFGVGAQVWLSAILGIIFMMMGWNFARFVAATLTGRPFETGVTWTAGPKAGQPVEYFELQGYTAYTETGIFLFGLACLLEAAAMAFCRNNTPGTRRLLSAALAVTVGMSLFNLFVAGLLFTSGLLPIISLLGVAFGGYMAMTQWQMLKAMRAAAGA